jgi:hypothetical protein
MKAVLLVLAIWSVVGCAASAPSTGVQALVIGFEDRVSREKAESMIRAIFAGSRQLEYELLYKDPRSLEAIREKFPHRALRAPHELPTQQPLVYKVNVRWDEKKINGLLATQGEWDGIEYIQRDLPAETYDH